MTHELSRISKEYERDTFIFTDTVPTRLLLGFNHHVTLVSVIDLERWSFIGEHTGTYTPSPLASSYIAPVTVHPFGILRYSIEQSGPALSRSSNPIPPGNYGWFFEDGTQMFPRLYNNPDIPFSLELLLQLPYHTFRTEKDIIPAEIEQQVALRDGGKCVLSSKAHDTTLTWIIPPGAAYLTGTHIVNPEHAKWKFYVSAGNVVTLTHDLAIQLKQNTFSVDVEHDRRILMFRDLGDLAGELPTYFPAGIVDNRFLFEHFRYSIRYNLLRGDIACEYPRDSIVEVMERLGVDNEDSEEVAPPDDPQWQTPIGQDILRDINES